MFTRQPDSIRKFAIAMGKNQYIKILFRRPYYSYMNWLSKRRICLFQKNARRVLEKFDKCLSKNDIMYSLIFGSMLGAIREHGFIKHDFDIDVGVWYDKDSITMEKHLKDEGFKLVHRLSVQQGELALEETYQKDNVSIDVFFLYPPINRLPYCCTFHACNGSTSFEDSMNKNGYIRVRRLELPWTKEVKRVCFEGIELPVMLNAEELLSIIYGDDYMHPNPHWTSSLENHYAMMWNDVKGVLCHER